MSWDLKWDDMFKIRIQHDELCDISSTDLSYSIDLKTNYNGLQTNHTVVDDERDMKIYKLCGEISDRINELSKLLKNNVNYL